MNNMKYAPTRGLDIIEISITDHPKFTLIFNMDAPVLKAQIYINIAINVKFWIINKTVALSIGLH